MSSHTPNKSFFSFLDSFEEFLAEYLVKKAPALPEDAKEFIVKASPWLAIIGVIITVPAIFSLIGLTSFMSGMGIPMYYGLGIGFGWTIYVSLIASIITAIFTAMAIPGLFERTKKSWKMVFYANCINLVSIIFNISVFSLIFCAIGFYILLQIQAKYVK